MNSALLTIGEVSQRGDHHFTSAEILEKVLYGLNTGRAAYDTVYCPEVWGLLSDQQGFRLIRDIQQALLPGGTLQIRKMENYPFLVQAFREYGFEFLKETDVNVLGESGQYVDFKRQKFPAVEEEPLVSVLIPAYSARFLATALNSALKQTYKNIEIVICDDDLSGEVEKAVKPYIKEKNVRYFKNESNLGSRKNYIQCIERSEGEFIKFLNDDDVLGHHCVAEMVRVVRQFDNVSLVTSHRQLIDEEGNALPEERFNSLLAENAVQIDGTSLINMVIDEGVNFIGEPTTVMFRRSSLKHITPDMFSFGSKTALRNGDVHLWLSLLQQGNAVYLPQSLSFFRQHGDQEQKQGRFLEKALEAWQDLKRRAKKRGYGITEGPVELKMTPIIRDEEVFSTTLMGHYSDTPKVSIIIPVYNKVEFTRLCLHRLYQNTPLALFEVIVVDNASQDESGEFLSKAADNFKNLRVITNKQNVGFSRANNQAAAQARGEYVVLLNNDTEPQSGWLDAMLDVIEKDKNVGAVGSKLLFPDGTIQHAGVAIYDDTAFGSDKFVPRHLYYGQPEDYADANIKRCYQVLTAACLMLRKKVYKQFNGLDERFWNGYEDVDLCLRLGEKGYLCVYQPESVLVHHESQSGPERFRKVNQNVQLLSDLWEHKIVHDVRVTEDYKVEILPQARFFNYQGPETVQPGNGKLVSIIMLTCNALEYTKKCVESIYQFTDHPFEMVLVDNASSDGTRGYIKKLARKHENITLVLNKENKGFAAGNNQGVKKASGDYIMLLNNDVVVSRGWLSVMFKALQKDENIGMVGPLTNSISGLQMLQNLPYKDMGGFHRFAAQFRAANEDKITPRRRIAGFAVLMKKALYSQVGGFDESFGIGNFEDDDLCLKVRAKGYAIMVAEGAFIHHFGSQSFKANGVDIFKSLEEKGNVFRQKWPEVDYDELLEMKKPLHEYHPRQIALASKALEAAEPEKAKELFSGVLKENPLSGEALFGLGMAHHAAGDTKEAGMFFERCLKLNPENAHVHNQLGMLAFLQQEPEKAEHHFAQAIAQDGSYVDAQRNYAQLLINKGDYENGVQAFSRILQNHPDDLPSLVTMCGFYLEVGNIAKADEYLERAAAIDSTDEGVQMLREQIRPAQKDTPSDENTVLTEANLFLEKGNPQQAADIYRAYTSGEGKNDVRAWFGLGLALQQLEQHQEALQAFEKVMANEPGFDVAWAQAAVEAFACEDFERAESYLRRAVELKPDPTNQRLLATVLIEKGAYDEGVSLLFSIVENHPNDGETLTLLAQIYEETGREEEAKNIMNRVDKISATESAEVQ